MAVTRQKKEESFAKIKGALKDAASVVFVAFRGLTVSEASRLRKELGNEEVGYTVVKKTLLRKAMQESGLEAPELPGEIAISYGTDLMAPARGIMSFLKKNPEKLSIEGGIFDGAVVSKEKMREIALIPGIDTLRAQFVNLINSPIARFAVVLKAVADKRGA